MRPQERQLIFALGEISRLKHNMRCGEQVREKEALEYKQRCEYLDLLRKQEWDDIKAHEELVSKILRKHPEYLDDYNEALASHGILADEAPA